MIVIPHHTTPTKFTMATVGLDMEDHGIESLKSFFEFADELEIDCSYIKIENRLQMDIINDEIILARLQKKYPGRIDHIVHRPADDISDGLEKYAAESKSNLIVLFSTHKNFIERLFDKSITKDLILHSKTSLLIYRY